MIARREVSNLGSGKARRSAFVLLPASFAMLALSGLTLRPSLLQEQANLEREAARRLLEGTLELGAAQERFESGGGERRVRAALRAAEALVPDELSELELFAALDLLTRRLGLDVESLNVGDPTDAYLPEEAARTAMRVVTLIGRGPAAGILELPNVLGTAGVPVAVLEFGLSREGDDGGLRFDLVLAVFQVRGSFEDGADGDPDRVSEGEAQRNGGSSK